MLHQFNHSPFSTFVLIYQNHLIAPAVAAAATYELGDTQIYPLVDGIMHVPLLHTQLVEKTNAVSLAEVLATPADPEVGDLLHKWAKHRTYCASQFASWVAVSAKSNTLRLYTPAETTNFIHHLTSNGLKLINEYIEVELPAKNQLGVMVLAPHHLPIPETMTNILESGILSPNMVAEHVIPKIAPLVGKYVAIALPVVPDTYNSVISAATT